MEVEFEYGQLVFVTIADHKIRAIVLSQYKDYCSLAVLPYPYLYTDPKIMENLMQHDPILIHNVKTSNIRAGHIIKPMGLKDLTNMGHKFGTLGEIIRTPKDQLLAQREDELREALITKATEHMITVDHITEYLKSELEALRVDKAIIEVHNDLSGSKFIKLKVSNRDLQDMEVSMFPNWPISVKLQFDNMTDREYASNGIKITRFDVIAKR